MTNHAARHWLALAMLFLLLPCLPACQWLDQRAAEGVTKRFVRAAVEGDYAKMRKTTDPDNNGYDDAKGLVEREFGPVSVRRQLDDLTLKTVYFDGERATVQAVGTVRYSIIYISSTAPVELRVDLIKKNGTWYVHDADTL